MFVSRPKAKEVIGCPNGHLDSKDYPVIKLIHSMSKHCFCPVCGKEVVAYIKSEENELVCDVCNYPVNPDWVFCMKCGSKGRREK